MKKNVYMGTRALLLPSLLLTSIFFVGCEKPVVSEEPSVTEQFEKIETTFEGGEKIENVAIKKDRRLASKEIVEQVAKKTAEMYALYEKRYSSARTIYAGYDVGVIPDQQSCPVWSEMIHFFMDNEDDSPNTDGAGWVGGWQVNDSNRNSHLRFCRVDGRLFPDNALYSVLALGDQRADAFEGTSDMYIDNEDHNNANTSDGDIYPNSSTANTILRIHSSNENVTTATFPDLGFGYGVFSYFLGGLATGWVVTDDQDKDNVNHIDYVSGAAGISFQTWINGKLKSSETIGLGSYRDEVVPNTQSVEKSGSFFGLTRVR